jgi:hypothetical protein
VNWLILPIWIIPTHRFDGEVVAYGWVIDLADGRVIRSATFRDDHRRWTQLRYDHENRRRLLDGQHEDALQDLAKQLLEGQ